MQDRFVVGTLWQHACHSATLMTTAEQNPFAQPQRVSWGVGCGKVFRFAVPCQK